MCGSKWAEIVKRASLFRRGESEEVCACTGSPDTVPGARRSTGRPVGQVADWRIATGDGGCVHIQEMPNGDYVVHKDSIDPRRSIVGHLAVDDPGTAASLTTAGSAAMGFAIGGPLGGFFGAIFGLFVSSRVLGRKNGNRN